MAGDMTVYGIRDKVKLIREDNQGKREIITLNLNDSDIINSPYYYCSRMTYFMSLPINDFQELRYQ